MRKLVLNSTQVAILRGYHNTQQLVFKDMGEYLRENLKIGSELEIETDNKRVKKHSGKYYLLYIEEFGTVFLFYVDTNRQLKTVYSGDILNALTAMYRNIGYGSVVKILKSSAKRAYRVVVCLGDEIEQVVHLPYKNKSSQPLEQVYLPLFDAIGLASKYAKTVKSPMHTVKVITEKGTSLFEL